MRAFSLFFTTIVFIFVNTWASEFQVNKSKENIVKFISQAPLEDFEGVTDKIDGYIIWQNNGHLDQSEFYFEVDLNSLDTGIGLRNRHMRDNYLETDKYPFASYAGKLTQLETQNDQNYEFKTEGIMTIHGVEQPFPANGTAHIDDKSAHVQIQFVVNLKDYKIKIPKLMFMKINELIRLELNFYLEKMSE